MYEFDEQQYEEDWEADQARTRYVNMHGYTPRIYIYCPVHGRTETFRGHCGECVLEVYKEHLEAEAYEAYLNGGIS